MINHFITYQSTNAPTNETWCAYLTKFKVFCFGATEQAAKDRAESFYRQMQAKAAVQDKSEASDLNAGKLPETGSKGRGHGNTGTVWMRHKEQGLVRVPLTEITMYEGKGYYRSGPRGK